MASNFDFLHPFRPEWFEEARKAERYALGDPRASCFYARRTLELFVTWMFDAEPALTLPYRLELGAKITDPGFKSVIAPGIWTKMDVIRRVANQAVHRPAPVTGHDSMRLLKELWHIMFWATRIYGPNGAELASSPPAFDHDLIERPLPEGERQLRQAEVKAMADEAARRQEELEAARAENAELRAAHEAEIAELQTQIRRQRARNEAVPDSHDYGEAETRRYLIDVLLAETGWVHGGRLSVEVPVEGLPTRTGKGKVDYVLWDDDGRPLGLVEAKKTSKDARNGQEQARRYADALERVHGQRPVIFYTNGYETWIWDDGFYPPRKVAGFYTADQLRTLVMRRAGRKNLRKEPTSRDIAGRDYQKRVITSVAEAFEKHQRHALLVMATGTGKTRVSIALVDKLMRAGWVKNVLFLADRKALVRQATTAFKRHLPGSAPVNLLEDKLTEGRVFVSTYQTMMGLIEQRGDGAQRRFGPGYFDLVIVDEAHRSIYQKYGALFDYFDALLLGLTATPRDEIDRNTYSRFELDDGDPTDVFDLDEAVALGYLVPPKGVDVPLVFPRLGKRYAELTEAERDQWDALEWDSEGNVPDRVEAEAVNRYLFNRDTVDEALKALMTKGVKVEGGDRLGKTIIFARNEKHAQFIVDRFNANYPEYRGEFARVVTHRTTYADQLMDDFAEADKAPHIAVSVDMLDTGIDIPEVVNLLLFKPVRSKTKYWQMIGRGTRLCPNLFGPDDDKKEFLVFDVCGNLDYFGLHLPGREGRVAPPIGEQVFRRRAELVHVLDEQYPPGSDAIGDDPETSTAGLRSATAHRLHEEVRGMNRDNFVVRTRLESVERFADFRAWEPPLGREALDTASELAGLPTGYRPEEDTSQEARRFDLLALQLQLAVLKHEADFDRLRERAAETASLLLDQTSIPAVAEHVVLLEAVAGEEWWTDVTVPMLEQMRRRLRGLVRLIDRARRNPVYSDFIDKAGELRETEVLGVSGVVDHKKFTERIRTYLRGHADEPAVAKLVHNEPITAAELDRLTEVFVQIGIATPEDLQHAEEQAGGLGLFLRTLIGMDADSVRRSFRDFCANREFTRQQWDFLNLLIDYLAHNGTIKVRVLYEPPFSHISHQGPDELFGEEQTDALLATIKAIDANAIP